MESFSIDSDPTRNKIEALRELPVFSRTEPDFLATIEKHVEIVTYRAGSPVMLERAKGYALCFILSGQVRVEVQRESDGDEPVTVPIAHRGAGEYVGELSLIDGQPHMADVIAVTACEILELDRQGFLLCMTRAPRFSFEIVKGLAARIRQSSREFVWNQSGGAMRRIATRLLLEMELPSATAASGEVRLDKTITHEKLAEAAGVTRETVTRTLANLKKVGAIRAEGRAIVIVNTARLKQCARRTKRSEVTLEELG